MSLLELIDWRRSVAELYAAVRAERHVPTAHGGWVAVRERLYAEHPCSPVDAGTFSGLHVAPYDPAWRAEVHLEPAPPLRLAAEAGPAGPVPFERAGVLHTPWGPLDAWRHDAWGGGLWVPVRDAGSASRSYGGGRYLLDTAEGADLGPGADGGLVVDLNFLYAPHCAHDPRLPCPLPPAGNALDVVVCAGELLPAPLNGGAWG